MEERSIPSCEGQRLVPAGQKIRKRIKKGCVKEGIKENFIYYCRYVRSSCVQGGVNMVFVYVCKQMNINEYLVITVFKYQ